MNKHPWDWLIHSTLCFIPVYFDWATWFVVGFVAILIEYEQWTGAGRPEIIHYIVYNSLGDLIADTLGITLGALCR